MTFIKKNNVKSITMDASLPRKKIIFLKNIANEINIPLIMIPSGLHAGKVYFDIYPMPKIGFFHPKYFFWRPLIKFLYKYEDFEILLEKDTNLDNIEGLRTALANSI